jgi:pyroglutamyl-peptidase
VDRLREAGIPAELSLSAGAYLCNQVFYSLLYHLASRQLTIPAGFIHLPRLPAQAAEQKTSTPSMGLDTCLAGVQLVIGVIAAQRL